MGTHSSRSPVGVKATIMSSGDSLMVGKENVGQVVNNMNLSASKPMLELGLFFPGRLEFSKSDLHAIG